MSDHGSITRELDGILVKALETIGKAADEKQLEDMRVKYLGRKSPMQGLMKALGGMEAEERKEFGKAVNDAKQQIATALDRRRDAIENEYYEKLAVSEWLDPTRPGIEPPKGHIHPVSKVQRELEDIFTSMGFIILDGPETENDYHNFEALNIPADHPARDMQDTFWTEDGNLLRTHTSPIQIRGMERLEPPFRVIGPGRVFRYEAIDASHENTFHQMEGMMIDREISVANVIYVMKVLLQEIFQKEVEVRLRPGYFPFVEPGFELDMKCLICGGSGCPVCKYSGWVEVLPCGLVHPNVLAKSGIDPEKWSGFAFGLGLTRLVMMRYGINDIRHIMSGDLRFLRQFD